jgi:hypothetical protein
VVPKPVPGVVCGVVCGVVPALAFAGRALALAFFVGAVPRPARWMAFSVDLVAGAVVAGLALAAFLAAVFVETAFPAGAAFVVLRVGMRTSSSPAHRAGRGRRS